MFCNQADSRRETDALAERGCISESDKRIEKIDIAAGHETAVVTIRIFRIVPVKEHHVLRSPQRGETEPLCIFHDRANRIGPRGLPDSDCRHSDLHEFSTISVRGAE